MSIFMVVITKSIVAVWTTINLDFDYSFNYFDMHSYWDDDSKHYCLHWHSYCQMSFLASFGANLVQDLIRHQTACRIKLQWLAK